jgi:luciferase family oxidoreductase group 1
MLGSSSDSALWAGELGLPYAFADFINQTGAAKAQLYRERFRPSRRGQAPEVVVSVSAICAETDEEAERLSASSRMAFTLLRRGQLIKVPPIDQALDFLSRGGALGGPGSPNGRRLVVGSPETVRAGLEAVAAEYGAGEVMVVTITYDHEARRRSYELLAGAFGLRSREP